MQSPPDSEHSQDSAEALAGDSGQLPRDADGWALSTRTATKSPIDGSTPKLMAMLAHALLYLGFNRIPLGMRQTLVSVFGMIALITPLILWVSWSEFMLLFFTGVGIFCVAALLIIVWLSPEDEL